MMDAKDAVGETTKKRLQWRTIGLLDGGYRAHDQEGDKIHKPPENDPDPYPMPQGLLAVSHRTETQKTIALLGQSS
jgi:hypothetical protein